MLAEILFQWLEPVSFLTANARTFTSELLSVLLFIGVIFLVAKIFKGIIHLFFDSAFISSRFPRLLGAMKSARFLGVAGYVVSAIAAIHLYVLFLPKDAAFVGPLFTRVVGIYVVSWFMFLATSVINILD